MFNLKHPLSLRALILGFILSAVVAMYSAFAGLQAGGVYWPIVTTSLISMAILHSLGKTDSNEINIMQTAASTGGLLAAGIIFTLPALFLLGIELSVLQIFLISIAGGTLGIIFTFPLRRQMIEKEKLSYADGAAAAAMLKAGDAGGEKAKTLFQAFGISSIYALIASLPSIIKNFPLIIPPVLGTEIKLGAASVPIATQTSLVPFAGGFLIGPKFTGAWFLGTLIGIALLSSGSTLINYELGIGIIIGASLSYFIFKGLPAFKNIFESWKGAKTKSIEGIAIIVSVGLVAILANFDIYLSIIALLGSFLMAFVAARVTGEMNIDPLEVFALIIMLLAKLFLGYSALYLVMLSAIVAIAAGMAGDFMQDLKSGSILGTKPEHQAISQFIGLLSASLVIGFVLISLNQTYKIGSDILPAPQAQALKGIVGASAISSSMQVGLVLGVLLLLISEFILNWGLVPIAFGIGLYVPIALSLPLFIGGMIRLFVERSYGKKKEPVVEKGRVISAGVIAGSGIIGVLVSLLLFFKVI